MVYYGLLDSSFLLSSFSEILYFFGTINLKIDPKVQCLSLSI